MVKGISAKQQVATCGLTSFSNHCKGERGSGKVRILLRILGGKTMGVIIAVVIVAAWSTAVVFIYKRVGKSED